ncbi:MAG: choice-of-anchor D domain-containing protein [Deltaproteobacteria bacterium]|nr:choice-of-anchor D domain-containing protein [Deltaproteobacteria bacterium]
MILIGGATGPGERGARDRVRPGRAWVAVPALLTFVACSDEELAQLTPRVRAEPAYVELGLTPVGTSARHIVAIASVGSAPLEVTGVAYVPGEDRVVSPDLGVTLAEALPRVLAVGQKLDAVVVHVPRDAEPDEGFVRVESNDSSTPVLDVPITHAALGGAEVAAVPDLATADAEAATTRGVQTTLAFVNLGLVPFGTTKRSSFFIVNLASGSRPLVVSGASVPATTTAVVTSSPDLSAAPAYLPALGADTAQVPTRSVEVEVSWAPATRGELLDTIITIESSDAARPRLEIPLRASTEVVDPPKLRIAPATLDFGDVAVGSSTSLSVRLFNDGASTLHVGPVSLDPALGAFSLTTAAAALTVAPGTSVDVEVQLTAAQPGPYSGKLLVPHDDPARAAPAEVGLAGNGDVIEICSNPVTDATEPANGACPGAVVRPAVALGFGGTEVRTWSDASIEQEGDSDWSRVQVSVDAGCTLTGYELTAQLSGLSENTEVCLHIGTCSSLQRTQCAQMGNRTRIYISALGSTVCDDFNNDVPVLVEVRHVAGQLSCAPYTLTFSAR